MHTFFLAQLPPSGEIAELEKRDAEHLFRTLRARVGEEVRLFDGVGNACFAQVEADRILRVTGICATAKPGVKVHLFTAAARRNRMDQLLFQAAEVGIASITPVEFDRSVATPDDSPDRWQVRLIEGCKQSWNPWVPQVGKPLKFAAALAQLRESGVAAYFGEIGGMAGIPAAVREEVAWIVGPEGGFTEEELLRMREAGFCGVRLGAYVMRLETAAVVGAALLMAAGEKA